MLKSVLWICIALWPCLSGLVIDLHWIDLNDFKRDNPPACSAEEACVWLYVRDGQAIRPDEELVEVLAVGDIMLGRGVQATPETFARMAGWVRRADLALGNFEGVLAAPSVDFRSLSNTRPGEPYRLVAPAGVEFLLQEAGFDVLSLANNHALDMQSAGLKYTLKRLQMSGLKTIGVGDDLSGVADPHILEINGLRIGLVGYNLILPAGNSLAAPAPAPYDPGLQAVREARQQADVVIVSMHWGIEYQTRIDPSQEAIAHALFDVGADIILGHHPHVIQGTLLAPDEDRNTPRRDRFAAFSLGNFVFDQFEDETRYGLALRMWVDQQGLRAVQALPVLATDQPRLLSEGEAQSLLARIDPPPTTLAFRCTSANCVEIAPPVASDRGIFWSGKIDLTGDGQAERVNLRNGVVEVLDGQTLLWHSPPEWQVLDLDLGDPNDDGRFEILLSIRKADEKGVQRSHPFILGYRGGMFKLLWGGSALSNPISEVALGDVDGDKRQELVVLEQIPGRVGRVVSVWRWHGWGFSLAWRSPLAAFENLVLVGDSQDGGLDILVQVPWRGVTE